MNVTTASRIEQYFRYGMPLVTKTLTLGGDCITNPGNYRVPIGMSVRDIIDAAGGLAKEPKKIIMGGPMMGRTLTSIDCPIIKANNAILCLDDEAILPRRRPASAAAAACACARWVSCPMRSIPPRAATMSSRSTSSPS